jgi:hypothetical protein
MPWLFAFGFSLMTLGIPPDSMVRRGMKRVAVAVAVLWVLALAILPGPVLAAADTTTAGGITLNATFESISVYASFSGDDNGSNSATLQWRPTGETSWRSGMAMTVDRRTQIHSYTADDRSWHLIANPYAQQFRASILKVKPDTSYDVRVTFADPDGVTGNNPLIESVTTRTERFALGTGTSYCVATTGSDSIRTGTIANPWQTIQYAVGRMVAGDTLYIRGGIYNEEVLIKGLNGASGSFITILPYPGENVVIDGGGGAEYALRLFDSSFIRISGGDRLTIQNTQGYGISLYSDSSDNVIEHLTVRAYGSSVDGGAGIAVERRSHRNLVQYCTVKDENAWTGDSSVESRPPGIRVTAETDNEVISEGNVIRYNTITSTNDGMGDYINSAADTWWYGGFGKDADVYGNICSGGGHDDGIEAEGGSINVRIWGNTVKGSKNSIISHAQTVVGPLYVFRNVGDAEGVTAVAVKGGATEGVYDGWAYFYHNTFFGVQQGFSSYGGDYKANEISLNNIVSNSSSGIKVYTGSLGLGNSFDYDCYYTDSFYWGSSMRFTSFKSASGQEAHGMVANPLFVNAGALDFRLQAGSPCRDAAVPLTGFNDSDSGWPYNGSGPDIGAYEYTETQPIVTPPAPEMKTSGVSGKLVSGIVVALLGVMVLMRVLAAYLRGGASQLTSR